MPHAIYTDTAFIHAISNLLSLPVPLRSHPIFDFKFTDAAAQNNAKILESFNFELDKAIQAQAGSPCSYGSEFRNWQSLKPILHRHPMWKNVKDILRDGATFPLEEISDANHQINITFMLEHGNHKSAHEHHETMKTLIEEDVIHGFSLPLTVECAMKIP